MPKGLGNIFVSRLVKERYSLKQFQYGHIIYFNLNKENYHKLGNGKSTTMKNQCIKTQGTLCLSFKAFHIQLSNTVHLGYGMTKKQLTVLSISDISGIIRQRQTKNYIYLLSTDIISIQSCLFS